MKKMMLVVLGMVLLTGMAFGDGSASRPIKPEETAFYQRVHEHLMACMPPALRGATRKGDEVSIPKMVEVGSENRPTPVSVFCQYDKAMSSEVMMSVGQDASSMEDLSNDMAKITEKLTEAATKGDQKEIARLQAEMQAAMNKNPLMNKMQKATADSRKDSAGIRIQVNANGAHYDFVKEIPAPAPACCAVRSDTTTGGPNAGDRTTVTYLFFGDFTKMVEGDTYKIYGKDLKGLGGKVHRLIVEISGDAALADEYIAAMDLKKLASLIN